MPPQLRQAPSLLKEKLSALGGSNTAPQTGQVSALPAATSGVGDRRWPFGHRWLPRREYISRRLFKSSVMVPKVLRTPGTAGRWCRASAAGMLDTLSTLASAAWVIRRRV